MIYRPVQAPVVISRSLSKNGDYHSKHTLKQGDCSLLNRNKKNNQPKVTNCVDVYPNELNAEWDPYPQYTIPQYSLPSCCDPKVQVFPNTIFLPADKQPLGLDVQFDPIYVPSNQQPPVVYQGHQNGVFCF